MYLRILKKDLRRKKTMNIIILLFVILASMFVASSVNNIVSVTTALDSFFEKAGVPDYFVATMGKSSGESVEDVLDDKLCSRIGKEEIFYLSAQNITLDGKEVESIDNTVFIQSADHLQIKLFDKNDKELENVAEDEIWISQKVLDKDEIKVGDTLKVELLGTEKEFKVAGGVKDAIFGSGLMGNIRIIMNDKDFEIFNSNDELAAYSGSLYYLDTDDVQAVETKLNSSDVSVVFQGAKSIIRMSYVMDMVIAGMLLVVSICLIVISFVVLRFTITFTLTEEFREIGVMKAIGLKKGYIRRLYIVKYAAIAVIGSALGFAASIPFGKMLLGMVSQSVMMENENGILVNLLCSLAVVVIILFFCYGCTRKADKYSPLDAIRSGETGERFRKKSLMRLGKSRLNTTSFMAVNDILSSPRRYSIIVITFTICLLLTHIVDTSANTLRSGDMVETLGMHLSDVYIADGKKMMSYMTDGGREKLDRDMADMEQLLADNDMPGKVSFEMMYRLGYEFDGNLVKSTTLQGINTDINDYSYIEGTAPRDADEVAVTRITADALGADIGDKITMHMGDERREFIITAIYQSMNNLGEGVRLHPDLDISFEYANGFLYYVIDFDDDPTEKVISDRIEKLKDIYGSGVEVLTPGQVAEDTTGVASVLDLVEKLVLVLSAVIIILVTVLMERSMISKELGEIAVLKAVGFSDMAVVLWHTKRFAITSVISTLLCMALSLPATKLAINPVFSMMGAFNGVSYHPRYLVIFLIYPVVFLVIMALSAFMTALYTRKIKASQTAGIE